MSQNEEIVRAFHVSYYDHRLEVDDFQTIKAESEDDVRDIFNSNYEDDRYEVTSVEVAYELNKTKIEDLLGELESI